MQITTIGLDLAKNVFQVHGVDADGPCPPKAPAPSGGAAVLRQASALPGRPGGLRYGAPLGTGAAGAGP